MVAIGSEPRSLPGRVTNNVTPAFLRCSVKQREARDIAEMPFATQPAEIAFHGEELRSERRVIRGIGGDCEVAAGQALAVRFDVQGHGVCVDVFCVERRREL